MPTRSAIAFLAALSLAPCEADAFETTAVTLDLAPGTPSSSSWPDAFVVGKAGDTDVLYFAASIGAGDHVWSSDGTPSGTFDLGEGERPFATPWGSVLFRAPWPGEGREIVESAPGATPQLRLALVPGPGEALGVTAVDTPFQGHVVFAVPGVGGVALGPNGTQVALGAIGGEFASSGGVLSSRGVSPEFSSFRFRASLQGPWIVLGPDPDVVDPGVFQMVTAFGDQACGKTHSLSHSLGALYCADLAAGHMRRVVGPASEAPALPDGTPYIRIGGAIYFVAADSRLWRADGTPHGIVAVSATADIRCIMPGGGTRILENTLEGASRWRDVATGAVGPLFATGIRCMRNRDASGFVSATHAPRWRNLTVATTSVLGDGRLAVFDGTTVSEVTVPGLTFEDAVPSFVGDRLVVVATDAAAGREPRVIELLLFDDGMED